MERLGEKRWCSKCKYGEPDPEGIICRNDESKFCGLEVSSVLCSPCRVKKTETEHQKALKYFDGYESPYDDLVIKGLKAITVLESICEHCGFEAGSKECNGCAIDTWRKGESSC